MKKCGYGNQIQHRQLQLPTNTFFAHTRTPCMNCAITLQCIQANYLLNLRQPLHVPSAYAFILLCQCKVEMSQIQYSNQPKYTAHCYDESPFKLWYSAQVFNKSVFKALNQQTAIQRQIITELQSHATLKLPLHTIHTYECARTHLDQTRAI